ncbi:MAG: type II toxin-antitoxin system VapC family toxin [Nitrospirota bacterium]
MVLIDVNVLVYAHRVDATGHDAIRTWLEDVVNGDHAYGISDLVLSGFVRIVTHPRVFDPPSQIAKALDFADEIRSQPHCVVVAPGARHWEIFTHLCRVAGAKGNLVADAYLAALAIESGCEWITTDRDYSRFPGLRWRHPLTES